MFSLAIWFGLAAGLLELALLVARVKVFEGGILLRSEHFVWMVPVSSLTLFLVTGLVLAWLVRSYPLKRPKLALGVIIVQACLGQLLLVRGLYAPACVLLAVGCSCVATPFVFARWPFFQPLVRRSTLALVAVVIVLLVFSFGRESLIRRRALEGRPPARAGAMNVLLVVLDTVRADHTSLVRHPRDTTPYLARLAADGIRFGRAQATAPWTLPSHASLFTGRWPHELDVERRNGLDASSPTLAEFLRSRGYATAGVVANQYFCGHETGLGRGFDDYRDYPVTFGDMFRSSTLGWLIWRYATLAHDELVARLGRSPEYRLHPSFQRKGADQVNREFLDWLTDHGDRPFFAFLNYFDAHDPYLVPDGFQHRRGRFPNSRAEAVFLRDWWQLSRQKHSADEIELVRDSYDDCIASLDQELANLFGELARRGVMERTVVIVTADHGEAFGEHGFFRHGFSLYESEVHVPLIIVAPSLVPRGQVVLEPVCLRDISATVTDLLGWQDESPFPGKSLARTWQAAKSSSPSTEELPRSELRPLIEPTFEGQSTPVGTTALFDESYSYIHPDVGPEELYDLDADPTESRDISKLPGSEPILIRFRRAFESLRPRSP